MNDNSESAALAKAVRDAGTSSCKSVNAANEVLRQVGFDYSAQYADVALARALGMMVSKPAKSSTDIPWDFKNLASALSNQSVNWVNVINALDYPEFKIIDAAGFEFIVAAFRTADKNGSRFPLEALWGRWNNVDGQVSLLREVVKASRSLLLNEWSASSKIFTRENFTQSNLDVQTHASSELESSIWNTLPLVETLMNIADNDTQEDVKPILDLGLKSSTELLFLGLAQLRTPWSPLHQDLVSKLLHVYLTGTGVIPQFVQTRLWQVNQGLLVSGLLDLYDHDRSSLPKILKISEDLSILNKILEVNSYTFAMDLAVMASRRDLLVLDQWLKNRVTVSQDNFVKACLDYIREGLRQDSQASSRKDLPVETIAIFLQVLLASPMSQENSAQLKGIYDICMQLHPQLANAVPSVDASPATTMEFSAEVEEATNEYYKRIYRGDVSIMEIVDLLQRFKDSPDARERDVYSCMIHNLFDEYRFFNTYREKELSITSDLFGALVQYQLVSYIPLGIALRYVLDALRNPPGSKMFNFGAQALTRFQSRLQEWPTYCSHLLLIPHLQQARPDITQYILTIAPSASAAESQDTSVVSENLTSSVAPPPPTLQEIQRLPPQASNPTATSSQAQAAPAFTSLNVDTLTSGQESVDYEAPNEQTQDKILFIVNNVSQNNIGTKLAEMKGLLRESAYRWFSNYIVVKRASIEPNYHALYLQFLDGIGSPLLYRHILHETYVNIKILMNSEKTVQSSSDRTLLKNLGSWLGGMTLARNKPIKHKNLAFKELIIEGYDSNRLIVVIPFVCKVLEQCNKSKVFKPPNPWLVGILRLLVELFQFADLTLQLKFAIEVLCKSLELDWKNIEPSSILKDRPPQGLVANSASLAQNFERLSTSDYSSPARAPAQPSTPLSGTIVTRQDSTNDLIPSLAAFVTFNPPAFFNERPALKRLVHLAIDRAIKEIVAPVVDRSVTIAGISTREMIMKDFAMEPNEEKMRKAAHLMVQNLAGSLALVTCKEPLRVSMVNIIRTLFLQNGFTEQTLPEQSILMTVNENLDLATSVIEKAAIEKAIPEIEESLATSFSNRKKQRERTGQPYYDMATYQASRYPANLPDPLRIKPPGLSLQQLRVYEDFARMSSVQSPFDVERSIRAPLNTKADSSQEYPFSANDVGYEAAPAVLSAHQTLEKFTQIIGELEKLVSLSPTIPWAGLPPNHDVKILAQLVPLLPAQSYSPDEMALTFSQKVVQLLYKSDSTLSREVYVVLLEQLCELSSKVTKEVTEWLIYADDERKFNVPVTVTLIKAGLVNLVDQDIQLARLTEIGRPGVVEFTIKLIRECVLSEQPCANRNEFINSLSVLHRLTQRGGKAVEPIVLLIEDIRRRSQAPNQTTKEINENTLLKEQLAFIFAEWIRVYQLPTANDKAYGAFINSIQQQGVLKGEEISSLFFRVCTEMSVESYLKYKSANAAAAYQGVDAFVKLIVTLVKHYSDPQGVNHNMAKVTYLTTLLSIIVLVLAQAHEQRREQFNQKPFLRLFSGLLTEMMATYESSPGMYFQILTAFSNTFQTLQPMVFPGFTFGWLSLISHRAFMPKLLLADGSKGWPLFQKLLVSLFRLLNPFLVGGELQDTTRALYKGTLRVMLVLLHDFPEFLCDYHFSFCDVIPSSCIQLRNLILSAFPRNMRLPDPFLPNLKVDLLTEIHHPPRVLSDYTSNLPLGFKRDLDAFLRNREQAGFLANIREALAADAASQNLISGGPKYNVPMINALVMYVGVNGATQLHAQTPESSSPIVQTPSMDIYQQLLNELDPEGRYLLLSAIANQLRYPNSHTHYFSRVLLYLFYETSQESIKEQITRVLLERLVVNRPHPWGLLITFIELIINPRYAFWDHAFTRIDPDIEKLFDSVSRSVKRST
ncbi:CCR4-Not complex component, Not1-domain-containing protein [Dissophora ornata]|nr:CCR4-Not complex component, Not1-domain-containing protein [Dissophora ornata]